jgi:hypothetical protein
LLFHQRTAPREPGPPCPPAGRVLHHDRPAGPCTTFHRLGLQASSTARATCDQHRVHAPPSGCRASPGAADRGSRFARPLAHLSSPSRGMFRSKVGAILKRDLGARSGTAGALLDEQFGELVPRPQPGVRCRPLFFVNLEYGASTVFPCGERPQCAVNPGSRTGRRRVREREMRCTSWAIPRAVCCGGTRSGRTRRSGLPQRGIWSTAPSAVFRQPGVRCFHRFPMR